MAERDGKTLNDDEIKQFKKWKHICRGNTNLSEITFYDATDIVRDGREGVGELDSVDDIPDTKEEEYMDF